MSKRAMIIGLALLVVGWLPARPARQVLAATSAMDVNSFLDEADDDIGDGNCHTATDHCTLRAAVMQANQVNGPKVDIILPAGTYTLTLYPVDLDGDNTGDLNLTTPASGNPVINILGAGAATTIIDGNQRDRVFRVEGGRMAVISGITLRNGLPVGSGAGIFNAGTLTVTQSIISGNSGQQAGGLANTGILHLIQSTVAGNYATGGDGGGINNIGNLYVDRSTLGFNQASRHGGAIYNDGTLFAENSTLSHNQVDGSGGGIYNQNIANVFNLTIAFNGADADFDQDGSSGGLGGGVFNESIGTFNLRNTLMAGNYLSNSPIYEDCSGTMSLYGRNITWTTDGCTFDTTNGARFQLNSLAYITALQNNGGPTWTDALRLGSNAIDGGDADHGCVGPTLQPLLTDQRGAARVVGARCDVGAFEYRPPLYLPFLRR
jgi:hypothetical protein